MSYMASEEYETAITHFNKAIEIDPYFVLAYMNIGEMYAQVSPYNVTFHWLLLII